MGLFVQSVYLSAGLSVLYVLALYCSNPFRRLPSITVMLVFMSGMFAIILVNLINALVPLPESTAAFSRYIRTGLLEEGVKFLLMIATIWKFRFSDVAEPMDIAIYFGILGVGFGVYEDFSYIFHGSYPLWTADEIGRLQEALRSIALARVFPGHILFNGLAGYLIGRARFSARLLLRLAWFCGGFVLAVVLHSLFNVIADVGGEIPLLIYIVFLVGLFLVFRQLAIVRSPFRALILMISENGEQGWDHPWPPIRYLFADGFAWPGKRKRELFQVFPLALSLVILYPLLVMIVYLVNRVVMQFLPV